MSNQNIKLKKEHTHDGVKYNVGSVLSVSQADADWLVKHNIADLQSEPVAEAKREGKKA